MKKKKNKKFNPADLDRYIQEAEKLEEKLKKEEEELGRLKEKKLVCEDTIRQGEEWLDRLFLYTGISEKDLEKIMESDKIQKDMQEKLERADKSAGMNASGIFSTVMSMLGNAYEE